jgi:hypothetical protein
MLAGPIGWAIENEVDGPTMSNHYKLPHRHRGRRASVSEGTAGLIGLAVIIGLGVVAFVSGNSINISAKPADGEVQAAGQRVPPVSIAPIHEPGARR